ncbi:MAG: hypothetical protein DHS20C12_13630 [Pseudohongiella sp.]|nr:MAG: hypothetical protein DHS20C12_13630 [Pseudohongiella sp.]
MHMNKIVQKLFLILFCLSSLLVFAGQAGFNGRIDAEGAIVDAETGQAIASVQLVITAARFDLLSESFRSSETERRTVDGAFEVNCSRCSSLRVLLYAEGYHSETHTFENLEDSERISINLRPVGEAVTLINYRGRVVVDQETERNRIFRVGSRPGAASSLESAQQDAQRAGEALRYIELLTELDENGAPVAVPRSTNRDPRLPVSASLNFSTADGGVVPYQPSAVSPLEIRREMIQAPADGYQPQLILDPGAGGPTWFYVRIGENFGRGQVFPPSLESTGSGQRLVVSFQLFLNPDGSRNLETVE